MTTPTRFVRARRLAGCAAATALLAAASSSVSGARAAAPPVPIFSPATTLDLPAMVLRPSDLPGWGTVDGDVMSGIGGSSSEYSSSIGLPDPADGGSSLLRKALTTVVLFPDDALAQARLQEDVAALGGSELTAPRQLVPDAPVMGDESFTATYVAETSDGTGTGQNLEIEMRVGPVIASVGITDFAGTAPTFEELAPLAEIVVGRVRDVVAQGTPGYSHLMVRLPDTDPWARNGSSEHYQALDGAYIPFAGEPADGAAQRTAFFTNGHVVDSYTFQQGMTHATTGEELSFNTWIYSFASELEAAGYLEYAVGDLVANPGGRTNVARVDVSGAAGPAVGASLGFTVGSGTAVDGFRIWMQAGSSVVSIMMGRSGGVPIEAVRDLANAQVACAQDPANLCAEVPAPAALLA